MKKLMLISFALALVISVLALAQEATQPGEMKAGNHESREGVGESGKPLRQS
jgi:hypothetical protein